MLAPKFLENHCPENTNLKERGIVLKKMILHHMYYI